MCQTSRAVLRLPDGPSAVAALALRLAHEVCLRMGSGTLNSTAAGLGCNWQGNRSSSNVRIAAQQQDHRWTQHHIDTPGNSSLLC